MIVLGDDNYGQRYLLASYVAIGAELAGTRAPFLVVPRSAGPPVSSLIREIWGSRRPFFLRQ